MDQNQPFKKRIIDQPLIATPKSVYVKSYQLKQQPNSPYIQYIPITESNLEQLQQTYQQTHHVQKQYQQLNQNDKDQHENILYTSSEPIRYETFEPPMTLNAWTQTNSDEFPAIKSNDNELLAKIDELEKQLRNQTYVIEQLQQRNIQSPSKLEQTVSNSTSALTPTKNDQTKTFRLLNRANKKSIDESIIYDLNENSENNDFNSSTVEVKLHNSITKQTHKTEKVCTPNQQLSNGSLVSIGPNGTKIPASEFEKITWKSASVATRKLLTLIFDRETLATHSMTGKASPAFKDLDKPVKNMLDPKAIQDIMFVVTQKCGVSTKEVRTAITTKCADENKMLKLKQIKKLTGGRNILTDSNIRNGIHKGNK